MTNTSYMAPAFERDKNLKASIYTTVVCMALLIIFFFTQWTLPQISKPLFEDGIEVNLGNSETGVGDEPPLIPGEASSQDQTNFTPPPASQPDVQEQPNITADENEPEDVPAIKKVEKAVVKNKPTDERVSKPVPNTTPTTIPTPKAPSPKAVYKGTNPNGAGNKADSYNNSRNQGIKPGPNDQGPPDGNVNSDSYKGNGPRGNGIRMSQNLLSRGSVSFPKLTVTEDWRGTVALSIVVNSVGTVISVEKIAKGTTPTLPNDAISFAKQKTYSFKYKQSSNPEERGMVYIQFTY